MTERSLRPAVFGRLTPGSVRPRGWLAERLGLERNGLTGRLDEISRYLRFDGNGWVEPENPAWEELPYWLRGLIELGYVTGEPDVIERAHRWVGAVLRTQAADGYFGPTALRTALDGGPDLWPHTLMVQVLRSYHEHTSDAQVVDFLRRYFGFLHTLPAEVFGRGWGAYRVADLIDVVCWLYEQVGPRGNEWLLELVHTIHRGGADFTTGIPTPHNVNIAQGFREPAQYAMLLDASSARQHTAASYRNYDTVMRRYGQFPGGGFAGDENCRPGHGDPRQGFETCGIVEFMHSFELLTRITGDPVWADRCEELAFNLLPVALDPTHRGIRYLVSANGVRLDRTQHTRGQFENHFPMQAYLPGVHNEPTAYRCCPHNYGIGWPYFVRELWLSTSDGGICASMYAPSEVTASIGKSDAGTESASEVTILADTRYPFEDTVAFTVTRVSDADGAEFPLWLRIPAWCDEPTVEVNGRQIRPDTTRAGYLRVEREWRVTDTVTLRLPMPLRVREWPDAGNALSVRRGPVHCSLAIEERWRTVPGEEDWPWFEVRPTSPWNYGLDLPADDPEAGLRITRRFAVSSDADPFTTEGVPYEIHAPARRIAQWTLDPDNVVRTLQPGPIASTAPLETVRLIPSGAARSRITMFPRIGHRDARRWDPSLVTASNCWPWEQVGGHWGPAGNGRSSVDAVNDHRPPADSADRSVPRLEWTGREGTAEWIVYDFGEPRTVREFGVYWYEDVGLGGPCRIPMSWRLSRRCTESGAAGGDTTDASSGEAISAAGDADEWVEVPNPDGYGLDVDRYNIVRFEPVTTSALRLEVWLADGASGGILHCVPG